VDTDEKATNTEAHHRLALLYLLNRPRGSGGLVTPRTCRVARPARSFGSLSTADLGCGRLWLRLRLWLGLGLLLGLRLEMRLRLQRARWF